MKMKQVKQLLVFSFIMLYILSMVSVATAFTKYTGQPGLPYLVFGNGMLPNGELQIKNIATGYTFTVRANADGYWQEDSTNWFTNNALRPPIMFGDIIQLTAITGCAPGDICVKTFSAYDTGYTVKAQIDFTLTGEAPVPPPPPVPAGNGGGGGGSRRSSNDGSGSGSGVKWTCGDWFTCNDIGMQTRACEDKRGNTKQESQSCSSSAPVVKKPVAKDEQVIVVPPVEELTKPVPPAKPKPITLPDDIGINPIIYAAMSIVIAGLGILWNYYKGTELKGKYRWIPGMRGILKRKLRDYGELGKEGTKEDIEKLEKTLMKYSHTITKKYLEKLLNK